MRKRGTSDYISADNFKPFPFEYRPKRKSVNLRMSEEFLSAVRAAAHRRKIPYQRFIRQILEAALSEANSPKIAKADRLAAEKHRPSKS